MTAAGLRTSCCARTCRSCRAQSDRVLLMTAYAHGAALLAAAWFETGASVELIGGVDVAYADELFARGEITAVFAPPTVLAKLVAGTRHRRIEGIKCVFCGTATLQPALYHAAATLFGPVIRVTYGKSEMFNPITVLEMDEAADYYRDLENIRRGVPRIAGARRRS